MKVDNSNWEDCQKYFGNTWIKVKECGERVYHVDHVSSAYTDLSSPPRGENDEDADIRIDMKNGYTIDYVIPKKTIFQYGKQAIVLQRIPARMWKKGMDSKNTEFLALNEKSTWGKVPINLSIIDGFVNKPSYFDLVTALAEFKTDLVSAAFSPRISMSKDGSVFIDTVFVAKYYMKDNAIKVKKIFVNDLVPFFPTTRVITV